MWNQILEDAIFGKVIGALIDEGFRVEISDQDGGGLHVYAAADGGEKPDTGYAYWVKLVPGNGPDIIVDYTTNLESIIKPINEFVARFQ